jgi:aromatic amino acid transport protein AroP
MLLGLAEQGDAPRSLAKVDKRGVPVRALLVSALVTFLAVIVNYVVPHNALELLMSLVVAALVINWAMISYSHLKFRQRMDRDGVRTGFRAFWFPAANYLCLAFVAFILVIMLMIPGIQVSVYAIPVWLLVMWGCYRLKQNGKVQAGKVASYEAG